MASQSLPHSLTHNQKGDAPVILNICRLPGGYCVELAGEGRRDVTPDVAKAMIEAAKREGVIASVHRWSSLVTWHIARGAS